ncbi:helix-turn-helix domain-containing protein [Marinobacter sp.]|uniref:helix-turn-helix domain-containing protein n=1 Tax=Marinobacter sp. TaxID=50741 RepID=UPI003A905897|tara:strand:+ start:3887 stop:4210 length:324 start_codon:yes stop_codon:yes gene_type:complete
MKEAPTVSSQSTNNNQLEQAQYNTDSTNVLPLSAAAQRTRILEYLKNHRALTTLQARHLLNVMHPAARVMELRDRGYKIITNWRKDADSAGRLHRVAEYVLMPEGEV